MRLISCLLALNGTHNIHISNLVNIEFHTNGQCSLLYWTVGYIVYHIQFYRFIYGSFTIHGFYCSQPQQTSCYKRNWHSTDFFNSSLIKNLTRHSVFPPSKKKFKSNLLRVESPIQFKRSSIPPVVFPPELLNLITSHLHDDRISPKAWASVVCRAYLPLCHSHLFFQD